MISVVVPAYNEGKHLEECLISIKNQTYSNTELIVVDDGSTDNTKYIAKKYADSLLSQKHLGPGAAKNKGAKAARGEILVFVDADMYLDKNFVKKIIGPITQRKALATFNKEEYIANPKNIWSKCFVIDNNLSYNLRINKNSSGTSTAFRAIKKDYFLKHGGYNTKLGYTDDHFFTQEESARAINAKGAICYHYNPSILKDVFLSARWVGRSKNKTVENILKYSIFNSIKISMQKIIDGATPQFLIYKVVFDFGIISGILTKNIKNNYSK